MLNVLRVLCTYGTVRHTYHIFIQKQFISFIYLLPFCQTYDSQFCGLAGAFLPSFYLPFCFLRSPRALFHRFDNYNLFISVSTVFFRRFMWKLRTKIILFFDHLLLLSISSRVLFELKSRKYCKRRWWECAVHRRQHRRPMTAQSSGKLSFCVCGVGRSLPNQMEMAGNDREWAGTGTGNNSVFKVIQERVQKKRKSTKIPASFFHWSPECTANLKRITKIFLWEKRWHSNVSCIMLIDSLSPRLSPQPITQLRKRTVKKQTFTVTLHYPRPR